MNKFLRFDWYALSLYLMLVGIGLVNIYSAVYDVDNTAIAARFMQKQLIALGIGIVFVRRYRELVLLKPNILYFRNTLCHRLYNFYEYFTVLGKPSLLFC